MCVILIKMYGWKMMYRIIGTAGVIGGLLTMLVVKEPERGVFEPKTEEAEAVKQEERKNPLTEFKDSLSDVFSNKVAKWNTIAGMFRFFETFSIVYFLPSFF